MTEPFDKHPGIISFRLEDGRFRWQNVDLQEYKHVGSAPFSEITRQVLFQGSSDLDTELRFFEIGPGGYSTLERHQHEHVVVIIEGQGQVLMGDRIHDVKAFDVVHIPSLTWHQFRATEESTLGFLCLVRCDRDRPQLPSKDDLSRLNQIPEVRAFIRTSEGAE